MYVDKHNYLPLLSAPEESDLRNQKAVKEALYEMSTEH
jgi:hypothetical protein